MRLEGKVAIITGGARGQGAAEARIFASEGAKVVIGDVLDTEGTRVAAEIAEAGGDAVYVHLDVTSEGDWQGAIGTAVSRFGKLDVLVNNAAIWRGGNVEETSSDHWDAVLDVNAKGVFLGTKLAIPEMRKAGGGSIINVSSTAGLVGSNTSTAYSSSKGAVRLFTQVCCNPVRQRGHQSQLHTPRSHRHAHGRPGVGHRGAPGGFHRQDCHREDGQARRHRLWCAISGLGRVFLRHRQ